MRVQSLRGGGGAGVGMSPVARLHGLSSSWALVLGGFQGPPSLLRPGSTLGFSSNDTGSYALLLPGPVSRVPYCE